MSNIEDQRFGKNYYPKNSPSWIFDRVANTLLNFKDIEALLVVLWNRYVFIRDCCIISLLISYDFKGMN